jgi:hypothetical protein
MVASCPGIVVCRRGRVMRACPVVGSCGVRRGISRVSCRRVVVSGIDDDRITVVTWVANGGSGMSADAWIDNNTAVRRSRYRVSVCAVFGRR